MITVSLSQSKCSNKCFLLFEDPELWERPVGQLISDESVQGGSLQGRAHMAEYAAG